MASLPPQRLPKVVVLPDSPKPCRNLRSTSYNAALHLSLIIEENEEEEEGEEVGSEDNLSSCASQAAGVAYILPRIVISEPSDDEDEGVASIIEPHVHGVPDSAERWRSCFDLMMERGGETASLLG